MPKSQCIDPKFIRKSGKITFTDIPVNAYQKTVAEERKNFSDKKLLQIYSDICTLREFESMLFQIKTQGEYNGFKQSYPGPAHLSLGQEAAAVGQAYLLTTDDYAFGSHRSHSEILAKGLSSIHQLSDDALTEIMEQFLGGKTLKAIRGHQKTKSVKELATDFLLYGALAEIFARENGFHHGLGGSMHAFFLPFGIYPNNAIVGGSGPIALGSALYKKCNDKKGIVIANIGDGALGCGPVLESLNFAAMDQFTQLWEKKGGLPILFNIFDNGYGMGGQTRGETMAYDFVARVGAGVCPSQMHAERVDGYNPLAVIDAMKRKLKLLREGKGPVLLDVVTYRTSGHSPSDSGSYRSKEELDAWIAEDPCIKWRKELVEAGVAPESAFDEIWADVKERTMKICKLAADPAVSPYIDMAKNPGPVEKLMLSNLRVPSMDTTRKPDALLPKEENPRVKSLASKFRFYLDENGQPVPKTKQYVLRDGLFEAILDKYYEDPTLVSYGEDVRDWGGAFAVYRGLTEALPYHRLFNAPISEAAIVGSAVGYALSGGRVIAELMYADFMGRAGDEIFNQLAKWQAMSAGILKMPVVLRVSVGSKYGAQHSQDWVALAAHIPGLKVVFPATPYDAKGLMAAALNGTDPVVFFESQRIYDMPEQFRKGGVPKESYEIELGMPDIKKAGSDVTILSIGATLYRVMEAAKTLEDKYNISAEVIDARSIVPFDYEPVLESVKKTGKIVLSSDACARGSILSDMARNITEMAFDWLDAPPVVVGARNWITPPYEFDADFFPQADWIIDAIHEKILPIAGYTPKTNLTVVEALRRSKMGV